MLGQFFAIGTLLSPIGALAALGFVLGWRRDPSLAHPNTRLGLLLLALLALPLPLAPAGILYSFPFYFFPLSDCVPFLLADLAGVILIGARLWRSSLPRRNRLAGLLLLGLFALPFPAATADIYYTRNVVEPREQAQVRQDSATLIQALAQFKNDTGRYPNDLSELTPNYLQVIPTITGGYPYKYKPKESEFSLEYWFRDHNGILGYMYCTFRSSNQKTYCDD